jgi:hypothetical protein
MYASCVISRQALCSIPFSSLGFVSSETESSNIYPFFLGSVGSMPLQFHEVGFHVEIHAIEWHDFQRETQFHGVVVA